MKADLHMHSIHSDGRFTPFELIDKAKQNNVNIIAITDHDVVGPMEEVLLYGDNVGVLVLPGIELSAIEQEKSVHILGYFTDQSYASKTMKDYFSMLKKKREDRAKKMIQNLQKYEDIHISYDRVLHFASGIIARPHIAKAIIEKYPDYDHNYVFDQFIGDTCKSYIPSVELPVLEGIEFLHKHNCLAVLAHPTLLKPQIKDTVLAYPFDGIEAVYFQNKPQEETQFRKLAQQRDLLVTGGSDFHGIRGDTKHGNIGDVYICSSDTKRFLRRLQKS